LAVLVGAVLCCFVTYGQDQPLKVPGANNPQAVAVVIGIKDYQSPDVPDVDFAISDARSVRQVLIDTLGYREANIRLLTDNQATLSRLRTLIKAQLPNLVSAGQSDLFLYFSGHGAPSANTKEAHLLPWDYDFGDEPSALNAYGIKDLYADLAALKAKSVTVMLEACFSGQTDSGIALLKNASALLIVNDNPVSGLGDNSVVITASGNQEVASWDRQHQHGLMTYHWLQAMRGEAADEQGRLTADTLKRYLVEKVPPDARRLQGRNQTPEVRSSPPNRVLASLPVSAVRQGQATIGVAYGSLRIIAIEGGDLFIDGVREITLQAGGVYDRQQIRVGPHNIEIRKDGVSLTRNVVVEPNKLLSETVRFTVDRGQVEVFSGRIAISVEQGGKVFIDGTETQTLPPFARFTTPDLPAGLHRVRVENSPAYAPVEQTVTVRPNETATLNVVLGTAAAPPPAPPPPAPTPTPRAPVANSLGMQFLRIEPGTFLMGCSGNTPCTVDERPAHTVRLTKAFEMGRTEVTQAQFQVIMGSLPPGSAVGVDLPVKNVTWNETQEFVQRLNARNDGWRYRLPTEAEWEYAARAGTTGEMPSSPPDSVGWHSGNSNGQLHIVGTKQPNAWGLYDMQGNLMEWVQDRFGAFSSEAQTDPVGPGPAAGPNRVLRGSTFFNPAAAMRLSTRSIGGPTDRAGGVGFRVVRESAPAAGR
jgi:formylglycine-generating enzyme required for sulfatase activity